jgi:hypothetical protein
MMLIILLVLALFGALLLVFHLTVEMNALEKSITALEEVIKKHYERTPTA